MNAWREALSRRASVKPAPRSNYPALLRTFLLARHAALSRRVAAAAR